MINTFRQFTLLALLAWFSSAGAQITVIENEQGEPKNQLEIIDENNESGAATQADDPVADTTDDSSTDAASETNQTAQEETPSDEAESLPPSHNAGADQAVIVFDASGSMWGQINGTPKITIARDVVAEVLADWGEATDLGLLAYGHRVKGECSDIETLIKPKRLNVDEFVDVVGKLNPKGKTPLTQAVVDAANELKYTENKATVILVSDGEETCDLDPCAIATELEKNGVDFTAHVIGFDVGGEKQAQARKQLKCVAENTGGSFFKAEDAASLKQALTETVKVVAEPEAAPKPKETVTGGAGNVKLLAVPAQGQPAFNKRGDVHYTVYENKTDLDGKRKKVDHSYKAQHIFQLAARTYVIVAQRGNAEVEQTIEVKAGELLEHIFNLNSGNLKLTAVPAQGQPAFNKRGDVHYTVYENKTDLDGERKKVDHSYKAQPIFQLAAGTYVVVVQRGNTEVEKIIEVKAGQLVEHNIDLSKPASQVNE